MPWEHRTVEDQREEFVLAAQGCSNFSALCRAFGISRKSGYKWLRRFEAGEALADRSRRPKQVGSRRPEAVERKILALRAKQPGWGARKLKVVLERAGEANIPSERTVGNILLRHGCIAPEESRKRQAFKRFEREHCNELWQTDFKGEFKTRDGRRRKSEAPLRSPESEPACRRRGTLLLSAGHPGRPQPLCPAYCRIRLDGASRHPRVCIRLSGIRPAADHPLGQRCAVCGVSQWVLTL